MVGEFYTPHEVSILMSEIVAEHLKDRTEIKIYDPTSGLCVIIMIVAISCCKQYTGIKEEEKLG